MILTIDCGNTRLKWALYARVTLAPKVAPPAPITQGSVLLRDLQQLDAPWHALPQPQAIVIANVAGDGLRAALGVLLSRWPVEPSWLLAAAASCGVRNCYEHPAQLGVDRWAALVAAWGRCAGACLVVSAGTATTIDALTVAGEFPGGRILAGVDLMKKALAGHTAGLPLAQGSYQLDPRNTADAIESGCLDAQAGAIERCHARLPAGSPCFITGGAAAAISARLTLNIVATVVDNLALEGLLRIALELDAVAPSGARP
ncbi:MAG: type III pantothenate kinase [Betaproteobacteria bacterium]